MAEAIGYENGVLGCLAAATQAFTAPGEAVLLHSPTYIGFTHVFEDNGRKMVLSDLVQDENGMVSVVTSIRDCTTEKEVADHEKT